MERRRITEVQGTSGRRLTIVDVAREAGVSVKTVSRVLNDQKGVGDKTRERVRDIMEAMGYKINKAARDLRLNRPTLIALLLDNPSRHMSSFNADLQIGAMRGCNKLGYYLIVDDYGSPESAYEEIVDNSDLAGVIVSPGLSDNLGMIAAFEERNIPYVRIAPQSEIERSFCVSIDDRGASRDLTKHLLDAGHRKIGVIKGHPDHLVSEIRYIGVVEAAISAGVTIDPAYVLPSLYDFKSGLKAAEKLLSMKERPTAIIASNDEVAAAVIAVAAKKGIKVPEELSVVGFDNAPISNSIYPALTTVNQPVAEMSKVAAELLIRDVLPSETQVKRVMLNYRVVFRDSVADISK
ncbi:LacI family DNA-binding transcriptional regulator [Hirschia litorea]|uniref:LacI family DNA-binding transcriptional regulator n=1 Tax=Hirschia litorea TaxID=1199156 RepID=A0ABW2IPF0_9PROT